MGTKNNPGNFDCYQNADPDEPMFVLLVRDPHAPYLVRMWAELRNGSPGDALHTLADAIKHVNKTSSHEKVQEAAECAEEMWRWRENR